MNRPAPAEASSFAIVAIANGALGDGLDAHGPFPSRSSLPLPATASSRPCGHHRVISAPSPDPVPARKGYAYGKAGVSSRAVDQDSATADDGSLPRSTAVPDGVPWARAGQQVGEGVGSRGAVVRVLTRSVASGQVLCGLLLGCWM